MFSKFGRVALRSSKPVAKFAQNFTSSSSKNSRTYNHLLYGLIGVGAVTTASGVYALYQDKTHHPISADSENTEILRKQKIISSVYKTMGVDIPINKIHISLNDKTVKSSFYQSSLSKDLYVEIPSSIEENPVNSEALLVGESARQASLSKNRSASTDNTVSGLMTGLTFASTRFLGLSPALIISAGVLSALTLYKTQRYDIQADKDAITYFPDYELEINKLITNNQEFPQNIKLYEQQRLTAIDEHKSLIQKEFNKQYAEIMRLIPLHRRSFNPIKPRDEYPHPLSRAYAEDGLHLNKKQKLAMQRLENSARIYISESTAQTLHDFFELNKQQDTPLGKLYQNISFTDFVERLITKTYKTVYLNGLALHGRHHHEDRLLKALPKYPNAEVACNLELLRNTGGNLDEAGVFNDYLSLEEICVKSLIITQAVCMPVGDGRRDTEYSEDAKLDTDFTIPVLESLHAAKKRPVSIASVSGIEARNGNSVHPDLFMIFSPEKPNRTWEDMSHSLRQSPLYKVSKSIYGDKLAIDNNPATYPKDKDFVLFGDGVYQDKWYLCKPAYKQRMKLLYKSLLSAADEQMYEYGLGNSYNLKGLGLGFFGFSQATPILEELSREALFETLAETNLKHIRQVNLINWPSQIDKADLEKPFHQQEKLQEVTSIQSVKVFEGISEPLSALKDAGNLGGTHACADAASQFGNEANIGMPPSSSDEAAIVYSLLNSDSLKSSKNTDLPLRIRPTI
ncbi:MAG: hypothetical protein P1U74_01870 [Legionellaceae bacterium]|nr:hypothetical protein [Legionellaceae bacterium]